MKSLSHVRLLATPWTAAHQAPPSMGFSRQEYWSGVPLPSPKGVLQNCISQKTVLLFCCTLVDGGLICGYFIEKNKCPLNPVDLLSDNRASVEKAMAPHSSTLAWKIPWTEEPGRLQSMGSRRVWTRLSNFPFTFHFPALEKEMATHSSVLAWRIPGTGEPGGLLSMRSQSQT